MCSIERGLRTRFVSRGLPRTAGWNGAATFYEGRRLVERQMSNSKYLIRPSGKTVTRRSSGEAARQAAAVRGIASVSFIRCVPGCKTFFPHKGEIVV